MAFVNQYYFQRREEQLRDLRTEDGEGGKTKEEGRGKMDDGGQQSEDGGQRAEDGDWKDRS
jgi:hypothetical protein